MKVRWEHQTGRYSDQLTALKRRIAALTRGREEFYIGRTSNPVARARGRDSERFGEMVVLYQTKSVANVMAMELELTYHFRDRCINAPGGGPTGDSPHYIYILR